MTAVTPSAAPVVTHAVTAAVTPRVQTGLQQASWQGGGRVISVAMLGAGRDAARYYLAREAGCRADYYLDRTEATGRWCGTGSAALGLTGALDEGGGEAFAALLTGEDPAGVALVRPVLRADPHARLPAAALVAAVRAEADRRRVDLHTLLGTDTLRCAHAGLVRRLEAGPSTGARVDVDARVAGRLATAAGLDPAAIYRATDGTDIYAQALAAAGRQVDIRRAGLDVTVSAPKSVSVLYALGLPATAEQITAAHEAAVAAAVGYLSRHASHALRGHQGGAPGDSARASRISTDGFVGAVFNHRTSRAGDPQLHSHVVLANLLRGADGRWSAVDARAVHLHALAAGYTYQAVLRGELTTRLGLAWSTPVKGVAEVAGVPAQLRAEFSQRRAAIVAELARTGTGGRRAAQWAAYATRPAKSRTAEPTLRQRWAERARAAGVEPRTLERSVLFRQQVPDRPTLGVLAAEVLGPAGVTRHRTAFDRRAALAAVAVSLPTGLPVTGTQLEALTDGVLASHDAVPLLASGDAGSGPEDTRFSSAELLAAEARALALAARASRMTPVDPARIAAALESSRLGTDQRAMVARLLASTSTVDVVVGPAGAGKTAALATARRLWAEMGTPVLGTALAVAARRLGASTGIPAGSLTRLLADCDRTDPATGRPGGLVPGPWWSWTRPGWSVPGR